MEDRIEDGEVTEDSEDQGVDGNDEHGKDVVCHHSEDASKQNQQALGEGDVDGVHFDDEMGIFFR